MNNAVYYLLAGLWILACVLVGLYIRGKGLAGKRHYTFGLKAIVLSYLIGAGLLVVALTLV